MPKVLIPTPLRQFTEKRGAVDVSGATVGEALNALTRQYRLSRAEGLLDKLRVILGRDSD